MNDSDRIRTVMERLYMLTRFPISLITENGRTVFHCPAKEGAFVTEGISQFVIRQYYAKGYTAQSPFPYIFVAKEGIFIGLLPVSDDQYLLLGPSLSFPIDISVTAKDYEQYFTREEFSRIYDICTNCSRTDSVMFANLLADVYEQIYHKPVDANHILEYNFIARSLFSVSHKSEGRQQPTRMGNPLVVEEFIEFENSLASAIASGNTTMLDSVWLRPISFLFPDMHESLDGDIFIMLPLLTIFRRAALEGGADSHDTFSLYDSIAKDLIHKKAVADYYSIISTASYRFCMLVSSAKNYGAYAVPAKKCERYIEEHLGEKITIRDLAVICGLSERQISRIFSECFHQGVTEYIHSERIRHAKLMLRSGKYKIIEISNQLGYSSQSHFSKTFYELTGYTPNDYKLKQIL